MSLALWPRHVVIRLRDDLVPVTDPTMADYVLVSHLQYFSTGPAGCTIESRVTVAGAPLVDTYHCARVSPTEQGFAAMNRPDGADDAVKLFQQALALDPHDHAATFGMGWAAQVKGDLPRAEALYVEAANGAARSNDPETEYFARFDLGTLYVARGENDKAADAFRAAIVVTDRAPERFADRTWRAWSSLGRALAAVGRVADARAAFERALAMHPGDPATIDALKALDEPVDAGADARRR